MHRIKYYSCGCGSRRDEGPELKPGDRVGSWPSEWIVVFTETNRQQDWQRVDLEPVERPLPY